MTPLKDSNLVHLMLTQLLHQNLHWAQGVGSNGATKSRRSVARQLFEWPDST